jgi:hypothetical protein
MAEKTEKSGEELKKGKWESSTFESRTEAQTREMLKASGLEVPSMAEGVKRKLAKGRLPSTREAAAARYAEKYGTNPGSKEIAGVEEKKSNPGNPGKFKSLKEIKELTKPVSPVSTEIKAKIAEEPKEKKFKRIIPAEAVARRKTEETPKREPFRITPAAEVESKIPQGEMPEGVTPDLESKLPPLREPRAAELGALSQLTREEKEIILEREGPESAEKPREISKTEAEEDEARRQFFQITLNRPDLKYSDLEAANLAEANKKLLKAAREKWVFAIHGQEQATKDGLKIMEFPDLDSAAALFLYKEAGFKNATKPKYLKKSEYLAGAMNIDTGGEVGMVLLPGKGTEEEGATAIGDHHTKKMEDARKDLSAARVHYEFLVKAGALRRSEKYDRLVDFVTFIDNKNYLDDSKYDDYFKHYFENSWQTLIGLRNYLQPHLLARFIKSEKDYNRILSDEELRQLRLIYTKREKVSEEPAGVKKAEVKNGEAEKGKEINYAERLKKAVEKSKQELERMQQEGFFVDSAKYGKIAVDIGQQVPGGVEAARAFGCGAYVRWTPETNSFLINTIKSLKESFSQGIGRHGRMWFKPFLDESSLNLKLEEILSKLTDGKFEPTLKLREFIKKEQKEMETKQLFEPKKLEILEKFGKEFYNTLKENASWKGYDEKNILITLEIQTKVFLNKQLKKLNLVGDDKIADLVEFLVKKISE